MPVFEMPLEELRRYQGRNPRPTDLEAYWESGLSEMRSLDPRVELVPSGFQVPFAECFDLYFTGVQDARIHAKYLRPKAGPSPHAAIVQFHGYSGNAGDWADKLSYVAAGFSVAALDCRGQAGQSEDPGGVTGNTLRGHIIRGLDQGAEHLLFRRIFLDTAQLAGIVLSMPEVDQGRVGVIGGSQGGGLALACGALEPRIQRVVSLYPFLSDYQRVWEMDLAQIAYEELRLFFRWFDPRHDREGAIFTRLGHIDVQHLAHRIRGKVLMGVGLMDQICPPSTQFAAYNKIESPKEMVLYPDFGHEGIPGFGDLAFQFLSLL